MFDKGYTICKTSYSYEQFGNWIVTLESQNCTIHLVQDRLELLLSLAPRNVELRDSFSLGAMIHFITKGREFIGLFEGNHSWGKKKQFERLANLLKEYHDKIVPYLDNTHPWESDFAKLKNEMISTQRKYNDLLIEGYRQTHRRK